MWFWMVKLTKLFLKLSVGQQNRPQQRQVDLARRKPKGPERDARVREAEARPTPTCDALSAG